MTRNTSCLVSVIVCAAAALMGVRASANQSVVLIPGTIGSFAIPSAAPFTTLGDTRVELRLHDWTAPASNANIFELAGMHIVIRTNGELCAHDDMDSVPDYEGWMCADITGKSDVVLRAQRDTSSKVFRFEVHSANNDWTAATYCGGKQYGSQGNTFPCPIRTVNINSWAGTRTIGSASANTKVAWAKWSSGVVPIGTLLHEMASADLADWRFEGDGRNNSGRGLNISISANYAQSPRYPPVCLAGPQFVFRAGFEGALDATSSYPMNGSGTLAYLWQQLSGPSTVTWSSQSVATPKITGMVFGSHVFQLTVTDTDGQFSTCTVKHGAVASDDNGVVITDNPAVDVILGPLIRYGANPWPWFDDRNKAAADVQIANYAPGGLYRNADGNPYWDIPGAGTITVTRGSKAVVGEGTTFTTTFCKGPTAPTVPKDNYASIIVWYPTTVGGSPTTGRMEIGYASCSDDTHMTLNGVWSDVSDGSGLNYTFVDDPMKIWLYGPAPSNYYDNVMAFYSLYYRSGIDDYLTAARTLADYWWRIPPIDRGRTLDMNNTMNAGLNMGNRSLSLTGMVLRALDGRPEMWDGLHLAWSRVLYMQDNPDRSWGLWDLREMSYHLVFTSLCALFDTDANYRSTCKTSISGAMDHVWTAYKSSDGGWNMLYYTKASWDPATTSVNLTQGSTTVTGIGTNWTATQISANPRIWFTDTPSRPASNAGGDPVVYTATWVDGTTLRLDRPYEGTTGTHGWALDNSGALGYGQQPFVMGILATALDFAAKAIADSDPTRSALAEDYRDSAVQWIKNYGYWSAKKGMYYFGGNVNCPAACEGADTDASSVRTLNAETMRGIGASYAHTKDASLLAFGNFLFSAMFSTPTSGPQPDGYYVSAWESDRGGFMTGTPPTGRGPKWFGMFFGFGANGTWPAYRVGGLAPAVPQPIEIGVDLASVPNASEVRVVLSGPAGDKTSTLCSSSPCTVIVDRRSGSQMVRLEYLSANGTILSTGMATALSDR